jgi:citrate synthase
MEMLRRRYRRLSFEDPAGVAIDRANERRKAARLTAQLPTIVARVRTSAATGSIPVEPDPSLSYAENFLTMLRGETPTEGRGRVRSTWR